MRYLKRKIHVEPYYDARSQRQRILRDGRVKRCGTCTYEIPEDDIVLEDGEERCPMCRDILTAEWKALEARNVADIKREALDRLFKPPQVSVRALQEAIPQGTNSITDASGNVLSQTSPLRMTRGVGTSLTLNGRYDVTNLGGATLPTGITVNGPTSSTATTRTFPLIADVGMAPGEYSFQYDGHTYRNILSVR